MNINSIQAKTLYNQAYTRAQDKKTEYPLPTFQSALADLKTRIIRKIDQCEARLDQLIPNFTFQSTFDSLWKQIDIYKSCLPKTFHRWMHDIGHGDWTQKLAAYLTKLPVRVAYNVLHNLFTLLKIIVSVPIHAAMHPLKIPLNAAKILIELLHTLAQPETWSRIGVSTMGSALATAAVSGNPLSAIAIGIGAALAFSGISLGTLKTALLAENGKLFNDVQNYLVKEAKQLTVDMLTGFCTVMLLEGIQQTMRGIQRTFQRIGRAIEHNREVQATQMILREQQIREFLIRHNLPEHDLMKYDGTSYSLHWRVDRAYLQDFIRDMPRTVPEGKSFMRDVLTHYEYDYQTIWVSGWYDSINDIWIDGHFDVVVVPVPIYEKFVGFDLNLVGWQEPAWKPLPPAMEINRNTYELMGTLPAIEKVAR